MNIKNEKHAREMLEKWRKLPIPAQKREIKLAIEKLELGGMYYEQKGSDQGVVRCEKCVIILEEHLKSLDD